MKRLALPPAWRRPSRLVLLLLLAFNLVVAGAFTVPRGLAQRQLDQRVAALRAEREAAAGRQAAQRAREELLARNRRDAAQLTGRLIGTREQTLVAALEELEGAGRELDLRFGARSLQPATVTDAPLTRLRIRLPVEGSYRALVIFVRRLEHSRRFLTVDELRLTEREGGQRATLDVGLSVYFRGELERPGGTRGRS